MRSNLAQIVTATVLSFGANSNRFRVAHQRKARKCHPAASCGLVRDQRLLHNLAARHLSCNAMRLDVAPAAIVEA